MHAKHQRLKNTEKATSQPHAVCVLYKRYFKTTANYNRIINILLFLLLQDIKLEQPDTACPTICRQYSNYVSAVIIKTLITAYTQITGSLFASPFKALVGLNSLDQNKVSPG